MVINVHSFNRPPQAILNGVVGFSKTAVKKAVPMMEGSSDCSYLTAQCMAISGKKAGHYGSIAQTILSSQS
jgi:hypothetical protein